MNDIATGIDWVNITFRSRLPIDNPSIRDFQAPVFPAIEKPAVYPPDSANGLFSGTLPSIVISESGFPFIKENENLQLWLCLLCFDESEFQSGAVREISSSLGNLDPNLQYFQGEEYEIQNFELLRIKRTLLSAILPDASTISDLTHIISNDGEDLQATVILSQRLPKAGSKTFAYLVSLAGQVDKNGALTGNWEKVDLISLYSWSFNSMEINSLGLEKGVTDQFEADLLAKSSRLNPLSYDLPQIQNSTFQSSSLISAPDFIGQGLPAYSGYSGPLTYPLKGKSPEIPVLSSNSLYQALPDSELVNVSYAAAWELGRKLSIHNRKFVSSLLGWKAERDIFLKNDQGGKSPDVPGNLSAWFTNLAWLEEVPFNYLIPDKKLIQSGVNYFQVDPNWLAALLDGALSPGRKTKQDLENDRKLAPYSPSLWKNAKSGILISSKLLSYYPDVVVSAKSSKGNQLNIISQNRYNDEFLLNLYNGTVSEIDISTTPEILHYAGDLSVNSKGNVSYTTFLKTPDTGKAIKGDPVTIEVSGQYNLVNIEGLKESLSKRISAVIYPGVLGLELAGLPGKSLKATVDFSDTDWPLDLVPSSNPVWKSKTENIPGNEKIWIPKAIPPPKSDPPPKQEGNSSSATPEKKSSTNKSIIHPIPDKPMPDKKPEKVPKPAGDSFPKDHMDLKYHLKIIIMILVASLFILAGVMGITDFIESKKDPKPLVTKFEGMRETSEMRFVQQIYREVIPISDKNDNLQFLMETQAYIYGLMDMSQMNYDVDEKNKIVNVTLPEASLSDPVIELDSTREYMLKGNKITLLLSGGSKKYDKAYVNIAAALERTKQGIRENAIKNGILKEVENRARVFVISSATSLGFQVNFRTPEHDKDLGDKIRDEVNKLVGKKPSEDDKKSTKGGIFNKLKKDEDEAKDVENAKNDLNPRP